MRLNTDLILRKTRHRDTLIFLLYALFTTAVIQFTIYSLLPFSTTRLALVLITIGQFYLTAYIRLPIRRFYLRKAAYFGFHILNFVIFRELTMALSPSFVVSDRYFEVTVVLLFLMCVLGRDIRMYTTLAVQLNELNQWTAQKKLFSKPATLSLHLGKEGQQKLHPNEVVYIRTKAAGDHTKVFGIKRKQPKGVTPRLAELETTAYANFESIAMELAKFPQFKRISQSTMVNFQYPNEQKDGVLKIEGRRFTISTKYQS
ncbi:MAG: hypothetical protein KI790_12290 [Cyclobacteriaceae bacterium]|nr:hypothetical protein [Cyclobacteriaceae bacterium HetDA_MAG_MS6]